MAVAATTDTDQPRPDELPGGSAYQQAWDQAERDGGRIWDHATPDERVLLITNAAMSRRRQGEQAERLGYASIDAYLDAQLDRHDDPTLYRQKKPADMRDPLGIDAADLIALDIPPLRWIVPDLIPEGTTVIASPPKLGKSCLVYQVCVETSLGGDLFGRRVTPGAALYLALEDGARRGKDRLLAALAGRTMPRGRLDVRWSSAKIGQGLEEEIERWLTAHPDATLVAIDTLGKVRARPDGKQQNSYQIDVDDLGRLQNLFRDGAVGLVIVHHARKEATDDFLASVSGTYGLTGSADTIVAIRRKRTETFGTISVTGRDVADAEIPVEFTGLTWQSAPAVVAEGRFERAEVFNLIRDRGPLFPKAIADELGKNRTAVQYLVNEMLNAGAIVRVSQGYIVPTDSETDSRARARTVPPDSTDSQSQVSQGVESPASRSQVSQGGQYARAIWCRDFNGHATRHRDVQSDPWCELCSPRPVAS